MFASLAVYIGLFVAFVGATAALKPLPFLGLPSRCMGAMVLVLGLSAVLCAVNLPVRETRVVAPRTEFDRFVPAFQFHERHSIRIAASAERVDRAIRAVTADEIALFRLLAWIRRMGCPGSESILNAPKRMPLLEVATRTSFLLLADQPKREIVIGTAVVAPRGWQPATRPTPESFRTLHEPGFALAAMNFRIEPAGAGACLLTTETRVHATDAAAARRFAGYWRLICPGSALIRRMWLRAVRRRAEA